VLRTQLLTQSYATTRYMVNCDW